MGCDRFEQKRYKQKFSKKHYTDTDIFIISIVPLQMYHNIDEWKTVI